ncbi:unnamed protein product [Mytilus coruscus]|uniref:Reverse transcriptase/retrotransposon-derived protein RNase H-like domain-containing protein n=1 Tax=Mytilus coruscus TaxID=42192 RepID=A0A6J8BXD8_MYTCO|nr:unnamed protein product [Mytilus coruscus]
MADLIDKDEPASTCFDLYKRMQVAEIAERVAERENQKWTIVRKPQSKSNGNNRGQFKRETRTCFVCNRKRYIAPECALRNKPQFKEVDHKQDKLALCLEKRGQTGPCSTIEEYAFKSGDFFRLLNDASYRRDLEQDASQFGLGAVLEQEFKDGRHPVIFISKKLRGAK